MPPAPGAEPPNELEILEAEIVDDGPTPRDSGAPASGAALTPFLSSEERDLDELLSGRYPSRTRQLLQDSRERELRRLREQGLNDLPDAGSTERR